MFLAPFEIGYSEGQISSFLEDFATKLCPLFYRLCVDYGDILLRKKKKKQQIIHTVATNKPLRKLLVASSPLIQCLSVISDKMFAMEKEKFRSFT